MLRAAGATIHSPGEGGVGAAIEFNGDIRIASGTAIVRVPSAALVLSAARLGLPYPLAPPGRGGRGSGPDPRDGDRREADRRGSDGEEQERLVVHHDGLLHQVLHFRASRIRAPLQGHRRTSPGSSPAASFLTREKAAPSLIGRPLVTDRNQPRAAFVAGVVLRAVNSEERRSCCCGFIVAVTAIPSGRQAPASFDVPEADRGAAFLHGRHAALLGGASSRWKIAGCDAVSGVRGEGGPGGRGNGAPFFRGPMNASLEWKLHVTASSSRCDAAWSGINDHAPTPARRGRGIPQPLLSFRVSHGELLNFHAVLRPDALTRAELHQLADTGPCWA